MGDGSDVAQRCSISLVESSLWQQRYHSQNVLERAFADESSVLGGRDAASP